MFDRLGGLQQAHDHVDRLAHHRVEPVVGDRKKLFVGREVARPDAEDRAPAGQVVEERHPLGDVVRVVERQAYHRGAEADAMRLRRRHGERHLGRRHGLPPAGMVLADEELVVVEARRRDG